MEGETRTAWNKLEKVQVTRRPGALIEEFLGTPTGTHLGLLERRGG